MNASGVADSCYLYRLTDLECDVNVLRTGLKDIEKVDILPAAFSYQWRYTLQLK